MPPEMGNLGISSLSHPTTDGKPLGNRSTLRRQRPLGNVNDTLARTSEHQACLAMFLDGHTGHRLPPVTRRTPARRPEAGQGAGRAQSTTVSSLGIRHTCGPSLTAIFPATSFSTALGTPRQPMDEAPSCKIDGLCVFVFDASSLSSVSLASLGLPLGSPSSQVGAGSQRSMGAGPRPPPPLMAS